MATPVIDFYTVLKEILFDTRAGANNPTTIDVNVQSIALEASQAQINFNQNIDVSSASISIAGEVATIDPSGQPDPLFVQQPAQGEQTVSLEPGPTIPLDGTVVVVPFGMTFPPGTVTSSSNIRVKRSGIEIPSKVEVTVSHMPFNGGGLNNSIASVRIFIEESWTSFSIKTLEVEWGVTRTQNFNDATLPVNDYWVTIDNDTFEPNQFPSNFTITPTTGGDAQAPRTVKQQAVFVTHDPAWLSICNINTHPEPFGTSDSDPFWNQHDDDVEFFGLVSVNDPATIATFGPNIELINFTQEFISGFPSHYSVWLYEKDQQLWHNYIRSGSARWMKEAQRATQFYAGNIRHGIDDDDNGTSFLKNPEWPCTGSDPKYSYTAGMLTELMLTGNDAHIPQINAVKDHWKRRPLRRVEYATDSTQWTEREQRCALLSYLHVWRLTGAASDETDVLDTITALRGMQTGNVFPAFTDKSFQVEATDHGDGCSGTNGINSPWMSAFAIDTVWQYYLTTKDTTALDILDDYGDFIVSLVTTLIPNGTSGDGFDNLRVPFYLVGTGHQAPSFDPCLANPLNNGNVGKNHDGEIEHAPDVLNSAIKCRYAKQLNASSTTAIDSVISDLKLSTTAIHDFWRPQGASGSRGPVDPPRKYQWWFLHGSDSSFLNSLFN